MTYERRRGVGSGPTPADRYRCRRARRAAAPVAPRPLEALTLDDVADPENLIASYRDRARRGPRAPGPDGFTPADLAPSQAAHVLRRYVSQQLRDGAYAFGRGRAVRIAKPTGGYRTIVVRNLLDSVVSAAVLRALAPAFDRVFLPCSYGFRRGRSATDMISAILAYAVAHDLYVLAVDDVRAAFDHVVVADVVGDFAQQVRDERLLHLIESVLRGGNRERLVGIDQGDPLSPLALNLRLHTIHDVPLTGDRAFPSVHRYADNVVYPCRTVPNGRLALLKSRRLLARAGLTLKGQDGDPTDLRRGGVAHILGFAVRLQGGRPRLGLGDGAWKGLEQGLAQAHQETDPPEAARRVVLGWLEFHGPAVEGPEAATTVARLVRVAAEAGFRELAPRDLLTRRLVESHTRWEVLLRDAYQRVRADTDGTPTGARGPSGPTVFRTPARGAGARGRVLGVRAPGTPAPTTGPTGTFPAGRHAGARGACAPAHGHTTSKEIDP
jgi:hypothetical protein